MSREETLRKLDELVAIIRDLPGHELVRMMEKYKVDPAKAAHYEVLARIIRGPNDEPG